MRRNYRKLAYGRNGNSLPKVSRSLSKDRYQQIKRYLHISSPLTTPLAKKGRWTKLEPLSPHIQQRYQELYLPGTLGYGHGGMLLISLGFVSN